MWASIEQVLSESPANQIVRSLALISDEKSHNLRQMTNNIDIKTDAEQLR